MGAVVFQTAAVCMGSSLDQGPFLRSQNSTTTFMKDPERNPNYPYVLWGALSGFRISRVVCLEGSFRGLGFRGVGFRD